MGISPLTEEFESSAEAGSDGALPPMPPTGAEQAGRPRGRRSVVAQILQPIGWAMVVSGLLLLEFAAFLVWGTGMKTHQAQKELAQQFAAAQISPDLAKRPALGDGIARIIIPKIKLDAIVVEGVSHDDLERGPGHIPETAFPGSDGSSVISGHRTTYAAPFGDIDQLTPGDEIRIQTVFGESKYVVTKSYIILPADTSVTQPLHPGEKPRLRLTTCNPRFSASQRLVVEADRVTPPGPISPP